MSQAPRPYTRPSRKRARATGPSIHDESSPAGTTSMWPSRMQVTPVGALLRGVDPAYDADRGVALDLAGEVGVRGDRVEIDAPLIDPEALAAHPGATRRCAAVSSPSRLGMATSPRRKAIRPSSSRAETAARSPRGLTNERLAPWIRRARSLVVAKDRPGQTRRAALGLERERRSPGRSPPRSLRTRGDAGSLGSRPA